MVTKLCPKIILEGTRLTGKTDIALTLNEHPRIVGKPQIPLSFAHRLSRMERLHQGPVGSQLDQFRGSRRTDRPGDLSDLGKTV